MNLSKFSRLQKIALIILILIISGFAAAQIIDPHKSNTCTKVECFCQTVTYPNSSDIPDIDNYTGPKDCNTCKRRDTIFHLGLIEVQELCTETEVYMCKAGEQSDKYQRDDGCEYKIRTILDSIP